ncbi:lactonase family protein [Halotalea alkalilenta]|uniref:6-phosphogluconolactonase n=1 Tax=Halotalea alkalilenta TaxID=376489 RepID=A0A172YH40_9GAMM|nr:lactonase family protein [Halotalea alkalilenta]ANF58513.1 hypothetical protein A5892_14370 [Halotalea alkalilenta]
MSERRLLIGTYTQGSSQGIHLYRFDTEGAKWQADGVIESESPSYLVATRDGRYLYAANEIGAERPGEVSALRFEAGSGEFTLLDRVSSQGADPCHLLLSPTERYLFVANYSGGSLAAFERRQDGGLNDAVQVFGFGGGSRVDPERQQAAHLHSCEISRDGRFLYACDLGNDCLYRYPLDELIEPGDNAPLDQRGFARLPLAPGSGPRMMRFGADGRFAYVIGELDGMIEVFRYAEGELESLQRISLAPPVLDDEEIVHGAAELALAPDGRFLYASNRGSRDEIVVYAVDASSGLLTLVGHQASGGRTPRHFNFIDEADGLLVGNQDSGSVVLLERSVASGRLAAPSASIAVDQPAFILSLPLR